MLHSVVCLADLDTAAGRGAAARGGGGGGGGPVSGIENTVHVYHRSEASRWGRLVRPGASTTSRNGVQHNGIQLRRSKKKTISFLDMG